MPDPIECNDVWEIVEQVIRQRGKVVLSVGISVDSPAGSGGWSVYQWEGAWWMCGLEGEWYGPYDPYPESLEGEDLLTVSPEGVWEIDGSMCRKFRPYFTVFQAGDESDEEGCRVQLGGVDYLVRQQGSAVVWKRTP
jgi:hypothetical protein